MSTFIRQSLILMLLAAVFSSAAQAATPSLGRISPPGGQRGTEMDIVFEGARLADAQEVFFYTPGFTVAQISVVNDNSVKVHIKIAPETALGEHCMRLRCASGISDLRTFYVGTFPMVAEVEPNNEFKTPQKIALNTTVTGIVQSEDMDYYVVEAKKGQRISAELEGIRLARTLFDGYVAILDANRFELSASDDSSMFLQDPVASCIAPADGNYIIQVRESSYGGDGNCIYRLHVGTFPRPRIAFPAGGPAGADLPVTFLGDVRGPIAQSFKLPAAASLRFPLFVQNENQTPTSANYVHVSPFANVMEKEPNDENAQATATDLALPLAFNGVIEKPGDNDVFKFKAKAGQQYEVNCYARRLRSPLDPVMYIMDKDGKALLNNDDSAGPDSYFRFGVPADGEYYLRVRDHLRSGSPLHVYRVEMTPVAAAIAVSVPLVNSFNLSDQERQAMAIPRGNRFGTLVRVTRTNVGGDMILTPEALPVGVKMLCETMPANVDVIPVVFEADLGAPIAGQLCGMNVKHADPKVVLAGTFAQKLDLVLGGNNTSYYATYVDRVPVAVTEECPFKIDIVEPKAPIAQTGSMSLKVVATRKPGFNQPINLRMLFNPPGIGSGSAQIPGDKNEAFIPLSCDGGAPPRAWKIAVLGQSDSKGPIWVSTQLANLEISPPFVTTKIDMAAAEQKQVAQVVCNLEQKIPFEGKAIIKLVGLPPNATTTDMEFTSKDSKVIFNVTTSEKTPAGQHKTLFNQIIVMKNGEPIVHNVGGGGILRVDPPPPPKPNAPPPPVAAAKPATPPPPPPPPTAKPLSRLEKLRLEAAEKEKK